MTLNPVQFQSRLSMAQFIQRYGTEAKLYRALYRVRWPQGFRCPRCSRQSPSRFRHASRVCHPYRTCRHQATLTSGTVFEGSTLPLTTLFLAMHLLTGSKTPMAAREPKRHLRACDIIACKLKHTIMQVMTECEEPHQLAGFLQVDDAYLGGERNGGKPGHDSDNKPPFVIAVATDLTPESLTSAVIEPVRSLENAAFTDWVRRHLAIDAEVFSDGLGCTRSINEQGHAHTVLETDGGRVATAHRGTRWVNMVLGNVKRVSSSCY